MTRPAPALPFTCDKRPASGDLGVVATNAPLGTAAGSAMLAAGGNAVDAAVAALLTLSVVEPMMVGIAGGGISHLRLADGRHVVFDALSVAGRNARADMFTPRPGAQPSDMDAVGRRNLVGPSAVAVPGNLRGWHEMHRRHGRLPWADVVEPAITAAARGFAVSHYLNGALAEHGADLLADPVIADLLMPGGAPAPVGSRMVMGDYAESLRLVQAQGCAALHGGDLGRALIDRLARGRPDEGGAGQGHVTLSDLADYRAVEREAIIGTYRGHQIAGPPPPASSGVHVVQMLNMLEAHDIRAMGFGSAESLALLARVIRVGFEDRAAASGDPAFVDVPVERYISKDYAAACQARLHDRADPVRAAGQESRDTTHVTIADRDGNIVTATHTLNGLFGARFMVPGTGIIPNNYMVNYDPRPGGALSILPGKRVPTSMAPMIVLRDGRPRFALGLPGGVRIFPSALQAIVNLIDHGMDLQHAIEAPRLWTQGGHVELEPAYAPMAPALRAMGYEVRLPKTIGGGMNAIAFDDQAPDADAPTPAVPSLRTTGRPMMTGAACWRADGTVMAHGGGLARPGVRFAL